MKVTAIILALLMVSSFAFKIRQNNSFNAAASDATAGVAALGSAVTDSAALIGDTVTAGTAFMNQAMGQLTQGMGAMMGMAGGARVQQNAGFGRAIADAQAAWSDVANAVNEGIQSMTDAVDGATQLTNQGIETLADAGGIGAQARLQQNPLGQVMGDGARVGADITLATEDFLTSFDEALDGISALTQQTLAGLAGAAGGQ